MRLPSPFPCVLLAIAISISLTGCSLSSTPGPTAEAGAAIQGVVHGGNQPITGAHVYVFAANAGVFTPNANGYGNASLSLLTPSVLVNSPLNSGQDTNGNYYVTSDVNGNFSISGAGDYSCTLNQQVYLYAVDGNPGLTAGTNNTSAGLLAVLGNCPGGTFSGTLFVDMNEVSTIAAAYAFAGFATDAVHVSSSGTGLALTGIANAFANAANLETLGTGMALTSTPTASTTSTVPQAQINTLADILAACINTTGTVSGPTNPTNCYTLFTNALSGGTTGSQPTDTATAAINIAHNPSANITPLWGLASSNPPFAGLSAKPNDFTIQLSFAPGGIDDPVGIAIDGSGNVWTANHGSSAVVKLSNLGAPLSGTNGYTTGVNQPYGIAIDSSTTPNAWVTNYGNNSVAELSNTGSLVGSPLTVGGLNEPIGIAIDTATTPNLWIANYNGASVSEISTSGTAASLSPFTGEGLSGPFGIAIDTSANVWVANSTGSSLTELTSSGSDHAGAPYSGGGIGNSAGVAFDSSGDAWISNLGTTTSSVTELSSSGTPSGGSPYTSGGLAAGGSGLIAVDGAGDVWVANVDVSNSSVSELSNSGSAISGSNGYTGPALSGNDPEGIAVDGSGNVWVTCIDSVVELVGAAAPVVTPLVVALKNSKLGTRP